jgi:hypothetical protein
MQLLCSLPYLPEGQSMQLLDPGVEYEPRLQAIQDDKELEGEYSPALQSKQEDELALLTFPGVQSIQEESPFELNRPEMHSKHVPAEV